MFSLIVNKSIPIRLLPASSNILPAHLRKIVNNNTIIRPISLKLKKPTFSFEKFKLKEDPPGMIIGGVNDPYIHPEPDYYHGSYHWTYERFVGVSLVPLSIIPFVSGIDLPLVDALLGTFILIHSHSGFQSCILDYIPKRKYGVWHNVAMWLLLTGTTTGLYGVYLIETEGSGLFELSKGVWNALGNTEEKYYG